MIKPPKFNSGTTKAVYDKTDGPMYFAKGGKIYRKGYVLGGGVEFSPTIHDPEKYLTPEQKLKYDSFTDEGSKDAYLTTLYKDINAAYNKEMSLGATTNSSASAPNSLTKGIGAAAPIVGEIGSNLIDQNMSDNNLTQKNVFSSGLKRAGQGAGIGTTIAPGVGTAIGAGVGALVGGIEGFIGGRKKEDARSAEEKLKASATALAEKQRREAAAIENMNPWETGVGMADGGLIKRKYKSGKEAVAKMKEIDALGKYNDLARNEILNPYLKKNNLQEIPYEKVNELLADKYPDFYKNIKAIADYHTPQDIEGIKSEFIDLIKNPQGTNEFGTNGNVPIEKTAYGKRMMSQKYPFYNDPIPVQNPASVIPKLKDGGLTPKKAKEILHDGTAHGKKLTEKQRKFFGAKSNGKSDGGKIKGEGTGKSDSIEAEVEEGSFVVPAINAKKAEEIRKKYLGKNKEAELEQEEGEDVMLSNGEHLFTPEEVEHLESQGVNLDELAPNAEEGKEEKKKGGKIKNKGYEFSLNNTELGSDIPEGNSLNKNVDIFSKQQSEITPPTAEGIAIAQEKIKTDPNNPKWKEYLSKASNFAGVGKGGLAGIAGLGLSAWQAKTGYDQLKGIGARPIDEIDSDFASTVDQAKNDAKYGISPLERSIAEKGIEASRIADVANITNLAGGSAGTALGNIRAASNQAQNNLGKLSAESERLRLEKQRYANALVGQKAQMNRRLFDDKMNAFQQNQQAGSELLGAGIRNIIGSLRYNKESRNMNDINNIGQVTV